MSNNRVQKRYPNGRIEIAAGQANAAGGSSATKLFGPRDVFADENENVFVADTGNQRIQLWKKNAKAGSTVAGNGSAGVALNEFKRPFAVTLDSKKNIIVADLDNQRAMKWPSTYDPETSHGTTIAVSHAYKIEGTEAFNDQFLGGIILGW